MDNNILQWYQWKNAIAALQSSNLICLHCIIDQFASFNKESSLKLDEAKLIINQES